MQSILNYKNLGKLLTSETKDLDLTFGPPEKNRGKYFSYLSYKNGPLHIQTPVLAVSSITENSLSFCIKKDTNLWNTLEAFDTFCVDYLFNNSALVFNGKKFSKEKITSSYTPSITYASDTFSTTLNESLLIRDQWNNIRTVNDIQPNMECIAILYIEGIAFTSDSIKVFYNIQQLKLYVKQSLNEWCISHDLDLETVVEENCIYENCEPLKRKSKSKSKKSKKGKSSLRDELKPTDDSDPTKQLDGGGEEEVEEKDITDITTDKEEIESVVSENDNDDNKTFF